ncbi:MAG: hypothetical protein OHK0053_24870 [Microscillaceae bacterium]
MNDTHVLIVERDEATTQKICAMLLSNNRSLSIEQTNHGKKALAMASKKPPQLIVVAIQLEGEWDGVQTIVQIQQKLGTHIPVIYLSTHRDPTTWERAKRTHPHNFFLKPLKEKEVEIALEMALFAV